MPRRDGAPVAADSRLPTMRASTSLSRCEGGRIAVKWMQDHTRMPVNRNELHALIDHLPESEIPAAQRFLQFLTMEPIGSEFAESIRRGKAQADAGDTVNCRDYREMVESLLGDDQS